MSVVIGQAKWLFTLLHIGLHAKLSCTRPPALSLPPPPLWWFDACRYIRVTQAWYNSRGQAPPSDDFIRKYYRQLRAQL